MAKRKTDPNEEPAARRSGTPANTSIVLTPLELAYCAKHGGKSAAIHAALAAAMRAEMAPASGLPMVELIAGQAGEMARAAQVMQTAVKLAADYETAATDLQREYAAARFKALMTAQTEGRR